IRNGPVIGGSATLKVRGVDISDVDDTMDDDRDAQGNNDNNDNDDEDDDGIENAMDDNQVDEMGQAFLPITFANKTDVTVNALGGNDLVVINAGTASAGLSTLTVDGGTGVNVLVRRATPAGVTTTFVNFSKQLTDDDDIFVEEEFEMRLGRE